MTELKETAAQKSPFEGESEEMLMLDRYLSDLKSGADALYEDSEVYGIVGWEKESAANSRLHEFCRALPKGAELHVHEMTLLPFDRYIEIVRKDAWIDLEEGDKCGYLYAENNPNKPEICGGNLSGRACI